MDRRLSQGHREADKLGPEPADVAELDLWREERWGAVVLLCGLADDNPDVLRRAASQVADEWADQRANALLLDAAALAAIDTDDETGG